MKCYTTGCRIGTVSIDYTGCTPVTSPAKWEQMEEVSPFYSDQFTPTTEGFTSLLFSDEDTVFISEMVLRSLGLIQEEIHLSPEWMARELEADADIQAGRVAGTFTDVKDLIEFLRRPR